MKKLLLMIMALLAAFAAAEELILPDSLTEIGEMAFYGNTGIQRAILPEGTARIGEMAFAESGLAFISLPDSLEYIADSAFLGTDNVEFAASADSYAGIWLRSHGYAGYSLTEGKATIAAAKGFSVYGAFCAPRDGRYIISAELPFTVTDREGNAASSTGGSGVICLMAEGAEALVCFSPDVTDESGLITLEIIALADGPVLAVGTNAIRAETPAIVECAFTPDISGIYGINLPDEFAWEICSPDGETVDKAAPALYSGITYTLRVRFEEAAEISAEISAPLYELSLGQAEVLIGKRETVTLRFTADVTGIYTFTSAGSRDTYAILRGTDGSEIGRDDDSGQGFNFRLETLLMRGESVQLDVSYSMSTLYGGTTVIVECDAYAPVLAIGENRVAVGCEDRPSCAFTAPANGVYTFESLGLYDTIGHLYEGNKHIAADDDGGEGSNFKIVYELRKGQQVTLLPCYYSSFDSGYMTIRISRESGEKTVYRALLIGQVSFKTVCERNRSDVNNMAAMLETVNGGAYNIVAKTDLTKEGVRQAISTAYAGATDDDVSLFFYASHGVTDAGYYYGAVETFDGGKIQTSELASWLSAVPGKVIVIIGTCGSGAFIENGEYVPDISAQIISAFAAADSRISGDTENTGELRANKFYVMTASMGGELSWGKEPEGNAFVDWFIESAGGTSSALTADFDLDGCLSLAESYRYVSGRAAVTAFKQDGYTYYQHPMVYPENSGYVLFTK